jgi:ankyrin repeat protein
MLIEINAKLEAKNKSGNTPLHRAALNNSLEVASLLMKYGANTDRVDLSWMN